MGRSFDYGAVAIVCEMVHGDKRVVQGLRRCDSALLVHDEHAAQEVDEFTSIHFLGQQLGTLKVRWNINLQQAETKCMDHPVNKSKALSSTVLHALPLTCPMSSKQLKMYFRASLLLILVSNCTSSGVRSRQNG